MLEEIKTYHLCFPVIQLRTQIDFQSLFQIFLVKHIPCSIKKQFEQIRDIYSLGVKPNLKWTKIISPTILCFVRIITILPWFLTKKKNPDYRTIHYFPSFFTAMYIYLFVIFQCMEIPYESRLHTPLVFF